MPVQIENTTLSLSEISRLREIVLQTSIILNTEIDPFTIENLNKSDWWQYENARQVLSQTLVVEGYDALPVFSISDINNSTLATVLVESVNESLLNGGSTSLLLIPTGAIESADGEFQRFVYDGVNTIDFEIEGEIYQFPIWYADLPLANRQSEYQISLKMQDLPDGKEAYLVIGDMSIAAFDASGLNYIQLTLRGGGGSHPTGFSHANLILNNANDQALSTDLLMLPSPTVGSIITLTLTTTALDYSWDGGSDSITLPVGFFATAPNLIAYSSSAEALVSDVMPLSIKVSATS